MQKKLLKNLIFQRRPSIRELSVLARPFWLRINLYGNNFFLTEPNPIILVSIERSREALLIEKKRIKIDKISKKLYAKDRQKSDFFEFSTCNFLVSWSIAYFCIEIASKHLVPSNDINFIIWSTMKKVMAFKVPRGKNDPDLYIKKNY